MGPRNLKQNDLAYLLRIKFSYDVNNNMDFPYWRGGRALSAHFLRGVIQMLAECVQGEGGGQKRPKNCVRTLCMAPIAFQILS